MKLIVNSLYSNPEIFLRELISNCADAMNKVKIEAETNPEILGEGEMSELNIRIIPDEDEETLTIIDRGIGMSKDELITNLGTIAHSGTLKFFEALSNNSKENDLIGEFGVGFYSSFLVADRVDVTSRRYNTSQYIWSSVDAKSFTISEDKNGEDLKRGTKVKLYLKDARYGNSSIVKALVQKYSQFVNFPIFVRFEKEDEYRYEQRMEMEEKIFKGENLDDIKETELQYDAFGNPIINEDALKEPEYEFIQVNEQSAIWTRDPNSTKIEDFVSQNEYEDFFHSVTYNAYRPDPPLAILHYHSGKEKGEIKYQTLLYVPPRIPPGRNQYSISRFSFLRLYVKKVLVTEELVDFLPDYLTYFRGVLEIEDLREPLFEGSATSKGEQEKEREERKKAKGEDPTEADNSILLNVSREMLQQSESLKLIAKHLTDKIVQMLVNLSERARKEVTEEDIENYEKYYREYSSEVKLGIRFDDAHREQLIKLLRFNTSLHTQRLLSLDDYVEQEVAKAKELEAEMAKNPEKRKKMRRQGRKPVSPERLPILYYAVETEDIDKALSFVRQSPFLQPFTNDDRDVLLLFDPYEEAILMRLSHWSGHPIISVQDELRRRVKEFEDVPSMRARFDKWRQELNSLVNWMSSVLAGRVDGVEVSTKLAMGDIEKAINAEKERKMSDTERSKRRKRIIKETEKYNKKKEMLLNKTNSTAEEKLKDSVRIEREGRNLAILKEQLYIENSIPCAIVAGMGGLSHGMNKIYQYNQRATEDMKKRWAHKVFEINPVSPLIRRLNKAYTTLQNKRKEELYTENNNGSETLSAEEKERREEIFKTELKKLELIVNTLFETSMLNSGYDISNKYSYTNGIFEIIKTMTGLPHAPVLPEDLTQDFDEYLKAEVEEEEKIKKEEKLEKQRKMKEKAEKSYSKEVGEDKEEEPDLSKMSMEERVEYEAKKKKEERKKKKKEERKRIEKRRRSHKRPDESYFEEFDNEEDPEDALQRKLKTRKEVRKKRKEQREKTKELINKNERKKPKIEKEDEMKEDEEAEEAQYQAERQKYLRKRQILMGGSFDDEEKEKKEDL